MSEYDAETKTWHGRRIPYQYPMDVTFGEIVLKNLTKNPDRILQICADDDTTLSCEQLRISSIRVAQNLQKIGVQEDDIIGLITHHSHFATSFITGCVLTGAIINPMDGDASEEDILHVYGSSKPKIIVCDGSAIPKLQRALKNVDFDYRIYSSTDATTTSTSTLHLNANNFLKPTGREENFEYPRFAKPSNEKLLMILCSSGTTGKPKSVCMSHEKCISWVSLLVLFTDPTPNRALLFSALYWLTGISIHLNVSWFENETRILTARKFSIDTFIELVEKYQITTVFTPPRTLNALLYSQKFLSSHNESLQKFGCGGAILSEGARKKFDELLPNRSLSIGYGMTEQSATLSAPFEYRQGLSVGSMIVPNVSIKIIDDEGNALDNGEAGEICLKSTSKFQGYYNNPQATKELISEDGFIRTGDIGYFNENGMLFVVDRKKDILKYKGIHVNPSDIEGVIESIEGVQTVSVVGIPDDLCVNLIAAAIIRRDGFESLTEKKILDFVASKLPEHKQLSGGVYFFKKLPTSLNDKILKRAVLEEILKLRKR